MLHGNWEMRKIIKWNVVLISRPDAGNSQEATFLKFLSRYLKRSRFHVTSWWTNT